MAPIIHWVLLGVALAAPQFSTPTQDDESPLESRDEVEKRAARVQAVLPSGFTPPPLNLPLGGVRTYAPVQTKNKITRHSSRTQIYTHTFARPVATQVNKVKAKIDLRALPDTFVRPPLDLPDGGIITYRTLPASTASPLVARDASAPAFTPPPLTIHDGGRHTLDDGVRFAAQHITFRPKAFSSSNHKKIATASRAPKVSQSHHTTMKAVRHSVTGSHSAVPTTKQHKGLVAQQLGDLIGNLPEAEVVKRENEPAAQAEPLVQPAATSDAEDVITTVYPSPGAPGIPITQQGEVITSYVPVTSCGADTASTDCQTSYSPTVTPICNTQLLPLGAPPYAVTDCYQYITYSSEYGYSFIPLTTAAPSAPGNVSPASNAACVSTSLQTRTTFYAAFWTDLNAGVLPTDYVKGIVCRDGYCGTAAVTFVLPTPPPTASGDADQLPIPTGAPSITQTQANRVQTELPIASESSQRTLDFGGPDTAAAAATPKRTFFKSAPQPGPSVVHPARPSHR